MNGLNRIRQVLDENDQIEDSKRLVTKILFQIVKISIIIEINAEKALDKYVKEREMLLKSH